MKISKGNNPIGLRYQAKNEKNTTHTTTQIITERIFFVLNISNHYLILKPLLIYFK